MNTSTEERTPLLTEHDRHIAPSNLVPQPDDIEAERQLDNKPHDIDDSTSWKTESWLLLKYAFPLIGTYLLQYFYTVVTVFVAGHIGADALAAASIGQTTFNITGMTIYEGMATALDTLCSQAYGSGNLKGVGLHMQRMMYLMALITVPVGAIWISSPWLLPFLVKQPELADRAGQFLQICLIGIPGYAAFEIGKRFMQAQGNFTASVIVLVVCAPVNVLLNWLFVFKLGWGLNGAALAQALTNNLRPVLLLIYICLFGRWSFRCWGGFTWDAFRNWGPMFRLSVPCASVNLAEWGAFEILTFSASWLSTNHLAAQTIMGIVSVIMWHIPFSISVAVSTRLGHLIGAGYLRVARRVTIFYSLVFLLTGLFDMLIIFVFRGPLIRLFTEDVSVRHIAENVMLIVAVFQVQDALLCGCNGTLRGLGRPDVAGWTVFSTNYFGNVPVAIWLELGKPQMGLEGVWATITVGGFVSVMIEVIIAKSMSWKKCVDAARSREGVEG